jgi:ribose 5-phosphate isomerase B
LNIAFGCDHSGIGFRKTIIDHIEKNGNKAIDFGTKLSDPCDYPDIASGVARSVISGKSDFGILLCGTGIGMSIAANKLPGIRAAVCWSKETAKLSREHNNSNVLCLSARFLSIDEVIEIIEAWLNTVFSDEIRHKKRIGKISAIEREFCGK